MLVGVARALARVRADDAVGRQLGLDLALARVPQDVQSDLPRGPAYGPEDARAVVTVGAGPLFLLARRRGGSFGARWGTPFSPAFW